MTVRTRSTLIGTLALVASLSAPLAFAQSAADAAVQATTPPASVQAQAAVAASPAQDTAAVGADAAANPAPVAQSDGQAAVAATGMPARRSWSDVDVNNDGALSKDEVASVPSLGQVFDKADENADGALTTAEYKNYVAKAQAKGGGGR